MHNTAADARAAGQVKQTDAVGYGLRAVTAGAGHVSPAVGAGGVNRGGGSQANQGSQAFYKNFLRSHQALVPIIRCSKTDL